MDRLAGASYPRSTDSRPGAGHPASPGSTTPPAGDEAVVCPPERIATRHEPHANNAFLAEDAYADHVVNMGSRYTLTSDDTARARQAIHRSVLSSLPRLADPQTAIAIRRTLLDALDNSPTFRHVVSFGAQAGLCPLQHITYINQYLMRPVFASFMRIGDLSSAHIDADHPDTQPIEMVPYTEHGETSHARTINLSAAPDPHTVDMPSWQAGLMHEMMHALTDALDPNDNPDMRIGPTEILAKRVASEMGWTIPAFSSYSHPARLLHLTQRNLRALQQATARHAAQERLFFQRLAIIADHPASLDFGELQTNQELLSELGRAPDQPAHPSRTRNEAKRPAQDPRATPPARQLSEIQSRAGMSQPDAEIGAAPAPQTNTAAPLPVFLANQPAPGHEPLNTSRAADAYAEQIVQTGARRPLTQQEISKIRTDLRIAVMASASRLLDTHTAHIILETIDRAVVASPTFRQCISFGLSNGLDPLQSIRYSNRYELNEDAGASSNWEHLNAGSINAEDPSASHILIYSAAEDSEEGEPDYPVVNIGVAPNWNSQDMASWMEGLIHEIVHHITSSNDPDDQGDTRLGPTEILAQRITSELELTVEQFAGYDDPLRNLHIAQRNMRALQDALQRHRGFHPQLFQRISSIAKFQSVATEMPRTEDEEQSYTMFLEAVEFHTLWGRPEQSQHPTAVREDHPVPSMRGGPSALETLAASIATLRSWDGQHGDIVPTLIPHLYPGVVLHIHHRNAQGELHTQTFRNPTVSAQRSRQVRLLLEDRHYSAVDANGRVIQVPADGDCFYHSLLLGLRGTRPLQSDIQTLRQRLADQVLVHQDRLAPFVLDTPAPSSAAQTSAPKRRAEPPADAEHPPKLRRNIQYERARRQLALVAHATEQYLAQFNRRLMNTLEQLGSADERAAHDLMSREYLAHAQQALGDRARPARNRLGRLGEAFLFALHQAIDYASTQELERVERFLIGPRVEQGGRPYLYSMLNHYDLMSLTEIGAAPLLIRKLAERQAAKTGTALPTVLKGYRRTLLTQKHLTREATLLRSPTNLYSQTVRWANTRPTLLRNMTSSLVAIQHDQTLGLMLFRLLQDNALMPDAAEIVAHKDNNGNWLRRGVDNLRTQPPSANVTRHIDEVRDTFSTSAQAYARERGGASLLTPRRDRNAARLEENIDQFFPFAMQEVRHPFGEAAYVRFRYLAELISRTEGDALHLIEYVGLIARALAHDQDRADGVQAIANTVLWRRLLCATEDSGLLTHFLTLAHASLPHMSPQQLRGIIDLLLSESPLVTRRLWATPACEPVIRAIQDRLSTAPAHASSTEPGARDAHASSYPLLQCGTEAFRTFAIELGEAFHSYTMLDLRIDENHRRLVSELRNTLGETAARQARKAWQDAYRNAGLYLPDSELRDRVQAFQDEVLAQWMPRLLESARTQYEAFYGQIYDRLHAQPDIDTVVERMLADTATEISVNGELAISARQSQASPVDAPLAQQPSEAWLFELYTRRTQQLLHMLDDAQGESGLTGEHASIRFGQRLERQAQHIMRGQIAEFDLFQNRPAQMDAQIQAGAAAPHRATARQPRAAGLATLVPPTGQIAPTLVLRGASTRPSENHAGDEASGTARVGSSFTAAHSSSGAGLASMSAPVATAGSPPSSGSAARAAATLSSPGVRAQTPRATSRTDPLPSMSGPSPAPSPLAATTSGAPPAVSSTERVATPARSALHATSIAPPTPPISSQGPHTPRTQSAISRVQVSSSAPRAPTIATLSTLSPPTHTPPTHWPALRMTLRTPAAVAAATSAAAPTSARSDTSTRGAHVAGGTVSWGAGQRLGTVTHPTTSRPGSAHDSHTAALQTANRYRVQAGDRVISAERAIASGLTITVSEDLKSRSINELASKLVTPQEQDAIETLAKREAEKQADAAQKAKREEQERDRKREEDYQARKTQAPASTQNPVPTGWSGRAHTLRDYAAHDTSTGDAGNLVHSQSRTASDGQHASPNRR